jgi:hypothetical protein
VNGGDERVTLTLRLQDPSSTPLTVVLTGTPVEGGGVAMASGSVALGPYSGQVTSLSGGSIGAVVRASVPLQLVISLNVDQSSGSLSGTVSASTSSAAGGSNR